MTTPQPGSGAGGSAAARGVPVAVVDLDRTLMYSVRWFAEYRCDGERVGVERLPGGRPGSGMHRLALPHLRRLLQRDVLVPCTSRSLSQYRRIEFPGGFAPALALVANGGHLLQHGRVTTTWHNARYREARDHVDLTAVLRSCDESLSGEVVDGVIGRIACPTPTDAALTAATLRTAHRLVVDVAVDGRKVLVVPRILSKARCAALALERHGLRLAMAAGDGLLDGNLLRRAPNALVPRHSSDLPHNLPRTQSAGPAAAIDILQAAVRHTDIG